MHSDKARLKPTLKYAGAFVAWVIGSGFATGQEILQFFSSYGLWSYAALLINLICFIIVGSVLLVKGYDRKNDAHADHFAFFCGQKAGKVYTVIIQVTLVLLISVLISAAGATLNQYFGLNKQIGSALMAVAVLAAYLIGFEKMVRIVSSIGPVIIVFSVFVGAFTVIRDRGAFSELGQNAVLLSSSQTSPHWLISSFLYISLNFLCGSTYYTQLGRTAQRRSEAKAGAIIGSVFLVLTIFLMNTAILLNAENSAELSVPTLYFAQKISYIFGAVFSVILVLGTFSSCSTMMWSFCSRIFADNKKKNTVTAVAVTAAAYVIGIFPFSGLVAVIYPAIGYLGLFFIACVIIKGIKIQKKTA